VDDEMSVACNVIGYVVIMSLGEPTFSLRGSFLQELVRSFCELDRLFCRVLLNISIFSQVNKLQRRIMGLVKSLPE